MGCRVEGQLPSTLLECAWAWAFQLPTSDIRNMDTFLMAGGLTKLEGASTFEL